MMLLSGQDTEYVDVKAGNTFDDFSRPLKTKMRSWSGRELGRVGFQSYPKNYGGICVEYRQDS